MRRGEEPAEAVEGLGELAGADGAGAAVALHSLHHLQACGRAVRVEEEKSRCQRLAYAQLQELHAPLTDAGAEPHPPHPPAGRW